MAPELAPIVVHVEILAGNMVERSEAKNNASCNCFSAGSPRDADPLRVLDLFHPARVSARRISSVSSAAGRKAIDLMFCPLCLGQALRHPYHPALDAA